MATNTNTSPKMATEHRNHETEMAERGILPTATDPLELTVDEVVENYVGSLGLSQIVHVFLVSLAWIFDSQNTLVTIFSDAQPPSWRCKLPTDHFLSQNSTALSSLCTAAGGGGGSIIKGHQESICGLPAGTWEWVGGGSSSIIAEWGLICDRKFFAGVPGSVFFIGSLLGSVCYALLADAYLGRKKTVLLSCVLTSLTALLTSFSPNIWIYALLRFLNGFSRSGIGCCLVLATEAVGRKWRGQVGNYGFLFYTVGFMSLPLIAFHTRTNWRNLYRVISLFPLVYSLLCIPFISESPRWLLIRGRNKEALDILKKYAKLNGKSLPSNLSLTDPLISKPNQTASEGEEADETKGKERLWTTPWAAKRMVTVMVAGFGIGFVYYGVQLNVENLNFNLYLTVALNALMEIPAVVIGTILFGIASRRLIFSLSAFLAGASSILCILFSHRIHHEKSKGSWGQLIIEGIGFMAASVAYDVLYVYCAELFPTNVRNFSVSMLRQTLMLGASIAPMMVVLGRMSPSLSFIMFGALSIFSGVISLWLPETRNAPLYETFKQQRESENRTGEANGNSRSSH